MPVLEVENLVERLAMLNAFRQGEATAVRAMYRRYGRLVDAVAHRALGRHDLAEEATQQTFVDAWRAADRMPSELDTHDGVWHLRHAIDACGAAWRCRRHPVQRHVVDDCEASRLRLRSVTTIAGLVGAVAVAK